MKVWKNGNFFGMIVRVSLVCARSELCLGFILGNELLVCFGVTIIILQEVGYYHMIYIFFYDFANMPLLDQRFFVFRQLILVFTHQHFVVLYCGHL